VDLGAGPFARSLFELLTIAARRAEKEAQRPSFRKNSRECHTTKRNPSRRTLDTPVHKKRRYRTGKAASSRT
jgi:hypothetical protein